MTIVEFPANPQDPTARAALRLRYIDEMGSAHDTMLETAAADVDLDRTLPCRKIGSRVGQAHLPGRYWCATNGLLLQYESRLELTWLTLLDFDPDVTAIATQPFEVRGRDDFGRWRRVPDIFVRQSDTSSHVIDVKPLSRTKDDRVKRSFERMRSAAHSVGWNYSVCTEPDEMLWANISWFSGFRRPHLRNESLADALLDAASEPQGLMALAERVGERIATLPVLYHLCWTGELRVDLTKPLREVSLVSKPAAT